MGLKVNIVAWNYFVNGMIFNLIKNLYVPFDILFDPKRYYTDGDYARMLWRPSFKIWLFHQEIRGTSTLGMLRVIVCLLAEPRGGYLLLGARWYTLILEFFSTFRFGEAVLDLDTVGALQFQLGGVRRHMSWREFILVLRLHTAEEMQTVGFGLYWTENARRILDKGDAPEKVTVTDLFYLRGMDVCSVNVPYLLARYLRLFALGRKQGAMIFGGQFVARLAEHFGLLTKERIQGLTVIVRDLLVIDMDELVRLQICVELDDTWSWVPAGPAGQEGDAGGVAEEAPVAQGGDDEDEEMPQAVPPPPWTQGERIARLEEEVHGMREALQGQREGRCALHEIFRVTDGVPETHQGEDGWCQHFHNPAAARPMIPLSRAQAKPSSSLTRLELSSKFKS
ncbi:hypothetical protein Tco_0710365 [Tanacetum coccineum]